jgi:hypothetical protein
MIIFWTGNPCAILGKKKHKTSIADQSGDPLKPYDMNEIRLTLIHRYMRILRRGQMLDHRGWGKNDRVHFLGEAKMRDECGIVAGVCSLK